MRRVPAAGWRSWATDVLLTLSLFAATQVSAASLVQLEAKGDESDVEALRVSLVDWLKPFKLELRRVVTLPTGNDPEVAARVRVDWQDVACVVEVFKADGSLARRKELPRGGPALLISESAALVAHAAIQELAVEKREVRVSEQPPPPVSEVLAAEPEKPSVEVSVAAWFQSRSWDRESPFVFGGGGEVAASLPIADFRPALSFLVAYTGPISRETAEANLQVQSLAFRLLLVAKRRVGAFEFEGGLGGGVDLLIATTTSSVVPDAFTKDRVDPSGFFTAGLGVRWHPTSSSGVMLRLVLDVDPARRRYVSRIADERTVVTVPWAVRPMIQLGFAFDLVRAP